MQTIVQVHEINHASIMKVFFRCNNALFTIQRRYSLPVRYRRTNQHYMKEYNYFRYTLCFGDTLITEPNIVNICFKVL